MMPAFVLTHWLFLRITVGLAVLSAGAVLAFRGRAKESPALVGLIAFGIFARVAGGLALFFISLFDLPFLSGLHTGDGFWTLAPDARGYYLAAASAAATGWQGLGALNPEMLSRPYVQALAVWMMALGIHPTTALFLNVVCYATCCWLLLRAFLLIPAPWRRRAEMFSIAALTCSPMSMFLAMHLLKDTLFVLITVMTCLGVWLVASFAADSGRIPSWRVLSVGAGVLLPGIYLLATLRPYHAFLVWACLGLSFLAAAATRQLAGVVRVGAVAVLLASTWTVFLLGAPGAATYARILRPDRLGRPVLDQLVAARRGFLSMSGGTNLAPADETNEAMEARAAARKRRAKAVAAAFPRMARSLRAVTLGLSTIFIPMSVLRSLSVVQFASSRSMVLFTDMDTLFFDLTILGGALLLWRAWPMARTSLPVVVFLVTFTVCLTGAMAYVVTNYGTLVRLRLMLAVPVWLLPLALCRAQSVGKHMTASDPVG